MVLIKEYRICMPLTVEEVSWVHHLWRESFIWVFWRHVYRWPQRSSEGLPRDFVSSDQARRFPRRRGPPAETEGPFVVYSFQQQFPIAPFTSSFCVGCSVVCSCLRMFFARTLPINALCPPSLNIALYSPLPPSRTMISAGVVDRLPTRAVISYTTVLVSCFSVWFF